MSGSNETIHPSPCEILEAFPEVCQPVSWEGRLSPSFSLDVDLRYESFTSVLNELQVFIMSTGSLPAVRHRNVFKCFVLICCWSADDLSCLGAGDAVGNSGEDIQLTTTVTHVDGPSEIYKMAGKEAQE